MNPSHVEKLLDLLRSPATLAPNQVAANAAWLFDASENDLLELLVGLLDLPTCFEGRGGDALCAALFAPLVRRQEHRAHLGDSNLSSELLAEIARLYSDASPENPIRPHLLLWLARGRGESELALFADLLADDPPATSQAACLPLSNLMRPGAYNPAPLFPRLFHALAHSQLAAPILDVSNFIARQGLLPHHPALPIVEQLATLLGGVAHRLGELQDRPAQSPAEAESATRTVEEGVALAVALCDTLALCGDPSVIGKLRVVLSLGHRRLSTEAAAALARLGEKEGEEALLALAAEPIARLRVLAYAAELGLEHRIPETLASPVARAEAELACWLAEPTQFGLPPSHCELLEQRTQYWPGFDEPVDCFLFRYNYQFGPAGFSNIGIAGPLSHAFSADLGNLPLDDIYALFAGWQAEHSDIYELDPEHWNQAERIEVTRLERRLRDAGCTNIRPLLLGFFFGERSLIAEVSREGSPCLAIADPQSESFLTLAPQRPLGPSEAWFLSKGRRLLRTFNEEA